jgi:hypothetical protein
MITGHKRVKIGGKSYTLRYPWKVLAEISAAHGDNPNLFDIDTVAAVGAMGIDDPEMTAEQIKELSPPLIPFAKNVQEALQWAYFGNEPLPAADPAEKKSPRRMAGLWRHLRRLFKRE